MRSTGAQMPQLDSLRAIAVTAVLAAHFWADIWGMGHAGVRLFFVMSGYLITQQLILARQDSRAPGTSRAPLQNFYFRRAFRLWPAHLLALTCLTLFNVEYIRNVALWHALFSTNILFALRNAYVPSTTSAWWSLAVEEQFYMLWPAVVIAFPKRLLTFSIVACVALAIAWRLTLIWCGVDNSKTAYWVLLPSSFDALGMGAWLAYANWKRVPWWLRIGSLIAIAGTILYENGIVYFWGDYAVLETLQTFAYMALVCGATAEYKGLLGSVLDNVTLRYVGKISYGIYLYHLIVDYTLRSLFEQVPAIHKYFEFNGPGKLLVVGFTTIVVASASWHFVERPILIRKRHFPFPTVEPLGSAR
jgi:peptidoglycan/LPS O-acetylase OafA/YrhL